MAKIYRSGPVEETFVFTVGPQVKTRSSRIKGNTSPRKQEQNDQRAVRALTRLIHCNFSHGDMLITLTYTDDNRPTDRKDALRVLQNFFKRIKRKMDKQDQVLQYLAVTSEKDGETGEPANVHHHIIMPRMGYEVVKELWALGTVDYQILRNQKDYTPLALYLIRQVKGLPDGKKWSGSRTLARPIVEEIILEPGEELVMPKGAELLHQGEKGPEIQSEYVRYLLPETVSQHKDRIGARIRRPRKRKG